MTSEPKSSGFFVVCDPSDWFFSVGVRPFSYFSILGHPAEVVAVIAKMASVIVVGNRRVTPLGWPLYTPAWINRQYVVAIAAADGWME